MKKCILLIMVILSGKAYGQPAAHSLGIGYGYVTREQLLNGMFSTNKNYSSNTEGQLNEAVAAAIFNTSKTVYYDDRKRTGAITMSYRYNCTNWLQAGVAATLDQERAPLIVSTAPYEYAKLGKYRRNAYTLSAEAAAVYGRRRVIETYGLVGLGVTFVDEKVSGSGGSRRITGNYFAFQLSPFAMRFGHRLCGFFEVGYGYKGLLYAGAAYAF